MNEPSPDMTTSYPIIHRQRGFSLIEALVAFLILSVGMLGIASLQTISLRAGQTATLRTVAVIKAEGILERMRANHTGLLAYIAGTGTGLTAPATLCAASSCTPTQMAQYDVYLWKQDIASGFPAGTTATISIPPPADPTLQPQLPWPVTVAITWKERDPSANALLNMTYSTTQAICGVSSC
jgi:type IV pilus assembly protein PilV